IYAITDNPDKYEHILGVFREWIDREEVALELSQVIDPRPDTEIDVNLLHREFEALGYSPGMLGENVNFMELVMTLVQAFSHAAAPQPELQGQIRIDYFPAIAGMTIRRPRSYTPRGALKSSSISESEPLERGFPARGWRFMALDHPTLSQSYGLTTSGRILAPCLARF
ncbi:MAG: hypothetical protein GY859_05425, partial [Desulfobacterales bacterium]|nr:hypothetical protein [Desulfobacterales bacterium]